MLRWGDCFRVDEERFCLCTSHCIKRMLRPLAVATEVSPLSLPSIRCHVDAHWPRYARSVPLQLASLAAHRIVAQVT